MRSARTAVWVLTLGLSLSLGCGPTIVLEEDTDEGTSSTGGPMSSPPVTTVASTVPPPPPPMTTTTTMPPGDGSSTGIETGVDFIIRSDPAPPDECDLWLQDCPEGEKCTPFANDGGFSWNALRCSPIVPDPDAPGDPCMVEGGPTSGIDTCDGTSMCFYVDTETNEGVCIAFCTGDETAPMCEPGANCAIPSDGVLALCIPDCDPVAQDCPGDQACYDVAGQFACAPDASGDMGVPGDPCEFINECDPGSACVQSEFVPGCMMTCCTAYCLTDDPMPPCLPGQSCEPYYDPGEAPPGYELLGLCVQL